MSEFLFVIPSDWTIISNEVVDLVTASSINSWISVNNMTLLSDALREAGVVPNGMNVTDAKYFNGEVLAVMIR